MTVLNMDCVEGLRLFPDSHFDSVVTDPPYELGFMGKSWDASGIAYSVEMWREVLRVLKPGGHVLAFSGSRTYHRMTCAIEDAGFEVRDQIMWVYGSGFPKSLDVSKSIDKAAGAEREVVSRRAAAVGFDTEKQGGGGWSAGEILTTAPATAAAQQWAGWGTALKPAHEPICVARKPLIGTVAANVLQHGTGAINVDGCRVGDDVITTIGSALLSTAAFGDYAGMTPTPHVGRWPANLIHDGSDEVVGAFPTTAPSRQGKPRGSAEPGEGWGMTQTGAEYSDAGTAARFFYAAKCSVKDRNEGLKSFEPATTTRPSDVVADNAYQRGATLRANIHPTVKPTDLMRYLVRLVTPPGGMVLDPFTGSGSTGKAAILEGFTFMGFELSAEYTAIAQARIDAARAAA